MQRTRRLSVFLLVFLTQIAAVLAAPAINSFKIDYSMPGEIQLSWDVNDTVNLYSIQIYQGNSQIYNTVVTGQHDEDLYQMTNDNLNHTYTIVAYDIFNYSAQKTINEIIQTNPPIVQSPLSIISNQKTYSFTTNEPAICMVGLSQSNMVKSNNGTYVQNHTIDLPFGNGQNNIFIQCIDEQNNEMNGFFVVSYIYDTTNPSAVSNITENENRLSWLPATDNNGVDYYVIYNTLGSIARTYQTYWDVTTNDSTFFISAVDKAGNEGGKTGFNMARAQLLNENYSPQNTPATQKSITSVQPNATEEQKQVSNLISEIGKIIIIIIGIIIVIFVGVRLYEHKIDPHGFRRYMKKRRKIRGVTAYKQ